jgi:uncharacterized protein YndB with AHSA1/START domain
MHKTNLQQQITVHALPSKIWKVLTNPDYVNQYFFDKQINCKWIEGSSILIIPDREEETESINRGNVLEALPGILLKFNFREGNTSSYITTTYELILDGEGVELKIKCEGFTATDQEYFLRAQHIRLLLQKIKWLSEYS